MGIEKDILRAAVAAELILSACTPIEPPTYKEAFHVVSETPVSQGDAMFSLITKNGVWKASDNNTDFSWRGKYCQGEVTLTYYDLGALCEGILIVARGQATANKGERLTCPEMQEAEKIECDTSKAEPQAIGIHLGYTALEIN